MHLPHTLHRWYVWSCILRIHNTYLQSKCFLSQLYNDTSCFLQQQSTLLCLATHRFTCVCHFSKQFTMHSRTSHLLQKYSVLPSGPIIFEAATLVMSHLNYNCEKYVYFSDRNVRWLCWSACCVFGCRVLVEVAICLF